MVIHTLMGKFQGSEIVPGAIYFLQIVHLRNTSMTKIYLWNGKHPNLLLYMQYVVCLMPKSS